MEEMFFSERIKVIDGLLGDERCFDMTSRMLQIAGRQAKLWVVNGFADDAVLERMVSVWLQIPNWDGIHTLEDFLARYVSIADVTVERDRNKAVTAVRRC